MASVSDRVGIKEAIVSLLNATYAATSGLEDVVCTFEAPGDVQTPGAVWLGSITGTQTMVTYSGDHKGRDDAFVIKSEIAVREGPDQVTAARRAQAILNATAAAISRKQAVSADYPSAVLGLGLCEGPASGSAPGNTASAVVQLDIEVTVPVRGA